ncbi:MAG: hypothetical protein ACLFUC_10805 [Bacteroidales bacterium]
MKLVEVLEDKQRKEFLRFPVRLYRHDPNYIRPLDEDIEKVFDPRANKFFRNGECTRWILLDANGKTIGKVAAFVDWKTAKNNDQPTGGMGFFDCINNQEAANKLFLMARDWLMARGMEAMDGPINFGDRDRWWGLLVDGFTPPNYCVPYNFPYYQKLFENFGFKNYFEQYTYYTPITDAGLKPGVRERATRIFRNADYSFRHIEKKRIGKYAEYFRIIYNKAWVKHSGVKPISKLHAEALIKSMKPILDEKLMWFAFYKDEPVAFYLMIPEINQIIRHLNGKMNWWGKIKFLYYKWKGETDKAFGLIFGVVPDHQGKGVEGAIIMAFAEIALRPDFGYKDLEMNWIGDFNPTMMKIAEQVGAKIAKTHITYRYLFDRNKEFKRANLSG